MPGPMRSFLAPVLALTLLAPAVAADWASFRNDELGSGFVPNSSYPVYEDVWWNNKTWRNQQIYASPVVKDNVVVVADRAGVVRGLDAESGAELWNHTMAAGVEGTPAIAGERVYVVDVKGSLKALNLRDGRVETTATVPVGPTFGSIREHLGKLFIGNEAGQMKAYYSQTLTLLWTFDLGQVSTAYGPPPGSAPTASSSCSGPVSAQPIRGAAAVHGGRVFFGSFNHVVFAVDEQGLGNGKTTLHWLARTEDIVAGSPSIGIVDSSNYRVFVGSYDGKLYAFDGDQASVGQKCTPAGDQWWANPVTPQWTYEVLTGVERKIESSPATDGTRVYFGANNGHVYAVQATDGTLAWEQDDTGSSRDSVTSSPAVANNIVVVGSRDKNVYWLSATSGDVLDFFPAQGAIGTSPAIEGNRAYIASTDGITYMFGPKVPPRPDLVVDSIVIGANSIAVAIKNIGTLEAGASKVRLLLDGTLLADKDVPAIGPGGNVTVTHATTVPPGTHKVRALADFGAPGAVKESNESNNALEASNEIAQPPPPPPVLQPTSTTGKGKIPGPGLSMLAGGLAAAALVARRRR